MSVDNHQRLRGRQVKSAPIVCTALVVGALLGGCGGGSGSHSSTSTATRTLALHFNFTRAVESAKLPASANSVIITITDSTGYKDTRTLNRPASDSTITELIAEFLALAPGKATITATAFTGPNGTGEKVGEATIEADLSPGKGVNPNFDFSLVYTQLQLTQNGNPVPATVEVLQDGTTTLAVRGLTDSGVVSQPNPAGSWKSSDDQVATVSPSGVITGKKPGTVTITFTDTANRSKSVTVAVRGGTAAVTVGGLIPAAAQSVKIDLLSGTTVVGTRTLVRPTNGNFVVSTTFTDVTKGAYTVRATAFPTATGTGVAQATGQATATITPGQTANIAPSMASTIASISISPDVIQFTTQTVTLTARALDASGNAVVTNAWQWQNSATNVLLLTPVTNSANATITALSPGTARITLKETESGKTFTKDVNVTVANTGQ